MEQRFRIDNMSCNHCVETVCGLISQVRGVEKVEVKLDQKEAIVIGIADSQSIIDAVNREGYYKASPKSDE